MKTATSLALCVVLASTSLAQTAPVPAVDEAAYYSVDFIPTQPGMVEVGGMDFLPDGRLVISTRHGQVWIVDHPNAANPADAKLTLFAEGLYEGLGLAVVKGEIYVVQRTELSRLRDTDGDGRCDTIDTLCNDWGVSGNYHEFAYGLPHDAQGNFYVSLNVSFFDPKWWHGKSPAPWRGWVLQIHPDGRLEPFACGFRSPNGLCFNAAGDLFVTDNQGDWMPAGPLVHVKQGEFYGHPASLEWTPEYQQYQKKASDTEAPLRPRTPPALWFPYGMSRSAGNPLLDTTAGRFGPFAGQMFVAELTNGCVMRVDLEKVEGEYQGACFQFRRNTGSANRICFAPDGTMFVGLTSRGWGGAPPADGLSRVKWNGRVPMEMQTIRLTRDGFDVGFTLPVVASVQPEPAQVHLAQYDYNNWWEYGSPEVHVTAVDVTAVELSADRAHLRIQAPKLQAGMVARLVLEGIAGAGKQGAEPLLHPQADYTVNRLLGMKTALPVAKTVEPPPTREDLEEGWVTLFNRRTIDGFEAPGWRLAAVHMDPADPAKFADHPMIEEGDGVLVNGPGAGDAVCKFLHGDCDARIDFCVTRGSNSGVYFMGRYEVQILDSFGKKEVDFGDCGGIYESAVEEDPGGNPFKGSAPRSNACNAPGEWQRFDVRFRAPRFDAKGRKVANAKFEWVKLNGTLIQENVEVQGPTRGGMPSGIQAGVNVPEVPFGPLRLQGDHGPVAYKKVRLKQIRDEHPADPVAAAGWVPVFDGKTLDGWKQSGAARWTVEEGAIVGRGEAGHLFSPRGDYKNYEQRAKVMINDAGNSGFYFRTTFGPDWPDGYEAQVNVSHPDPQRSGSLYGLVPVTVPLVQTDLWYETSVRCVDEAGGTHITIQLNGVVVVDFVDQERRHATGHLCLQQHNEGSEVRFKEIEVRELPAAAQ